LAVLEIGEALIFKDTFINVQNESGNSEDDIPKYCLVQYKGRNGYIDAGCLAFAMLNHKSIETSFLFRVGYHHVDAGHKLGIKEIFNHTFISKFELPLQGELLSVALAGTKGLDSICDLITIDYLSEACGMEGGMTYLTWNPGKITMLAFLSEVSDAGVYYIEEDLVFPSDSGGVKGQLVFKSDTYELIDDTTGWFRETKEERIYRWTNGQMMPAFRSKPEE
jgi:hypothetical protein